MRRWLTVVLLAPLLIGCTSRPNQPNEPAGTAPMTSTPSPDRPEPAPTTPGPRATSPTPPSTSASGPPPTGGTPPPDERRGDLVRGRRTLTGTVSRDGACVILLVGDKRWSLTGAPAERLADGANVRVTGTVGTTVATCPADHALLVTRAQPA